MYKQPAGVMGLYTGLAVFLAIGAIILPTRPRGEDELEPKLGAFDPFLTKYLRIGEFIIGLASGSIILLVGSAALHKEGQLPSSFASPLWLLCWCVLYGVIFMCWLTFHYEYHQLHKMKHSRFAWSLNLTLGLSAVVCFAVGYAWLIFEVAR